MSGNLYSHQNLKKLRTYSLKLRTILLTVSYFKSPTLFSVIFLLSIGFKNKQDAEGYKYNLN